MTVQRHDRPHPGIERTFTAVRAALPAGDVPLAMGSFVMRIYLAGRGDRGAVVRPGPVVRQLLFLGRGRCR